MFKNLLITTIIILSLNCATVPIRPVTYPTEEQKFYEKKEHWDNPAVREGPANDTYITIFPMFRESRKGYIPKVCAGNVGDNAGLRIYIFNTTRNMALFDKFLQQNTGACENIATFPGDFLHISLTPIRPKQIADNARYNTGVAKDKAWRGGRIARDATKNFTKGAKKTTETLVNTGKLDFNDDPLLPPKNKYPPTRSFIPLTSPIEYKIQIGADLPPSSLDSPPMIHQESIQKTEIEKQLDEEAKKIIREKKNISMTYFLDGASVDQLIVKNNNDQPISFSLMINCKITIAMTFPQGEEKKFSLLIKPGAKVAVFTKTGDNMGIQLDSFVLIGDGTVTEIESDCL